MSRPHQQRPLAAPPPPPSLLPTEVAIVCVFDDKARSSDRWNAVAGEGGYLERFVQRLAQTHQGQHKQLRLSLLNFASQFNPSHTPISHTQYFVAPTEFWASLRQQHHSPPSQTPASSTIDLFSPPASPRPETSSSTVTGGEQGLLEGLVGGLELFDLHTSHPFVLPTPSPSPPYIPQHPVPSSSSSSSSNPSPQNNSHLSPPNSGLNSSTSQQASPRPNVERYLFLFLGDDSSSSATSPPPPLGAETKKAGRWANKTTGGAGGVAARVRWNRTRKLDGVGWDGLGLELRKRGVMSSLIGMGVGTGEGELSRVKDLFKKNSLVPSDTLWFPTAKGDLVLLYGLDPTKTHLKRPHSQTSPPSTTDASPSSNASSISQKRQRVTHSGGLSLPPSTTSTNPSSAVLHAQIQQQQLQRLPDVHDLQAQRIQAAQRMLASNPQALAAQLAARGQPGAHPLLGGMPGVPPALQAQYNALLPVAAANNGGAGAGGASFDLAGVNPNSNYAQEYHRQRLQAQATAAANGTPPIAPSVAAPLPTQQQLQQQALGARPPQQPSQGGPKVLWTGDLGWQVNGANKGATGPNLGCRIVVTMATKTPPEEYQTHLWGERLQLATAIAFKTEELKVYATRGTPCVSLRCHPDPKASAEDRASGERSYALLANSLSTKQIAGVVNIGPPGCGMIVFPMSSSVKTPQNPSGTAQLMGMVFLRSPIPEHLSARKMTNNNPSGPHQPQNNLQQQHEPPLPPNLTIKTFPASVQHLQQQSQQQQQQIALQRAKAALMQQSHQSTQRLQQQMQNNHQQPNLNFPGGAGAGRNAYGGPSAGGGGGAANAVLTDAQMQELMSSYAPQGTGGGQRWP